MNCRRCTYLGAYPNATEFKVNELTVYLFYEFLAEAMSSEIDDIAE